MDSLFFEQRRENVFMGPICDHPYPTHIHDVVEIICPATGTLDLTIAGQKYHIKAGDIAVIFPFLPHSYVDMSDISGIALIFLPDTIQEFCRTFRTRMPEDPIVPLSAQDQQLIYLNDMLRRLCQSRENQHLMLGYLHLFLSYLLPYLQLDMLALTSHKNLCQQILHHIAEHYTEPLSLESTARVLGISRSYLSHFFSQQLKLNFRQYINMLRVNQALILLRDSSNSISQVAYLCGYGNERTFHRAFCSLFGKSPSQYRATLDKPREGSFSL